MAAEGSTPCPSRSPSGGKDPAAELRSLLYGPGFRIIVSVGLGYIARRLWAGPQESLDSKLAQLRAAPTIHSSAINEYRDIPREGELVVIQNGVVRSIRDSRGKKCRCSDITGATADDAVVTKPVESYVSQSRPSQYVCGAPFGLTKEGGGGGSYIIVKNVDADHLQLESRRVTGARLNEPVRWIRFMRVGTRLESVFGRLSRKEKGGIGIGIEIEPCGDFPKECFTMTRSEIKRAVRAQAEPNVSRGRRFSVGVGFLSFGVALSGLYSYAMN